MLNRKNVRVHLLALCILVVNFLLCRYVFTFHKMYQWPVVLLVLGMFVIGLSFLVGGKIVPMASSAGYLIGFIAGAIFQTEGVDAGGGRTNNMWLLWAVVFVCIILGAAAAEPIYAALKGKDK